MNIRYSHFVLLLMLIIITLKGYGQSIDTTSNSVIELTKKEIQLPVKLPDFVEVYYLKLKLESKFARNYYLYAMDTLFVYVLAKDFFSDPMPSNIQEDDLEIYSIHDIDYVRIKKRMIYSTTYLQNNKWLLKERIWNSVNAFLLTAGISGGIGLLFDAAFAGFSLFPFFTALYSGIGVIAGLIVIASEIIKNRFFKRSFFEWNHLYFSENLRLKYVFNDGKLSANREAISKMNLKEFTRENH